tara:strand:+ start:4650 stop:4943 length:294 start_codon:yes stop_codon:yes gene_type:complete
MTSPSKGPIYYLTVRLSYRRNKRDVNTDTWVITRYQDPVDIMLYDDKTMQRLRREYYGKRKVKDRPISILEVLSVTVLGREYQSQNDKKGPDSGSDE